MKLTKRKGFNFFRSYYDVYNELETDSDKVAFISALLDRQFLGTKPTDLSGMAKFAYVSQTNSIDSQVKGYNDKMVKLGNPTIGVQTPPAIGVDLPPTVGVKKNNFTPTLQEKEKEKEKVNIINNSIFVKKILSDNSYLEVMAMQTKTNIETISKYLKDFELRLIQVDEQKPNLREFKSHFTNWFNRQDVKIIYKQKKMKY